MEACNVEISLVTGLYNCGAAQHVPSVVKSRLVDSPERLRGTSALPCGADMYAANVETGCQRYWCHKITTDVSVVAPAGFFITLTAHAGRARHGPNQSPRLANCLSQRRNCRVYVRLYGLLVSWSDDWR